MAQFTNKYKLGYFERGDYTSETIESNRWRTVDAQMFAIFDMLGNGVIDGWVMSIEPGSLNLNISPGSGHVGYVSVSSEETRTIELIPNILNYIYAVSDESSYYTKNVSFETSSTYFELDSYLLLGNVLTSENAIINIDISDRKYISTKQQIIDFVKGHRHIGGTNNPSKINLETDVQGLLNPDNIDDLDASMILGGVLNYNVIPSIDHIENLLHTGTLTHSQLDTFVQILSGSGQRLMGEISSVNLLKLILSIKHIYPEIDDFLINELAFIPGISPDDIVDKDNTTAEVDYRPASEGGTHTIKGTSADSVSMFTKSWDTKEELETGIFNNVVMVGNSLMLNTIEQKSIIDDFENVSGWETIITDTSTIASSFIIDEAISSGKPPSGRLDVGGEDSEVGFILKKSFSSQNWTSFNNLVFQMYCNDATHGDILFFLFDQTAGSQNSYTMVLERNSPTINQTTKNIGWREVVIDISNYSRENITAVGFYTSTSYGWVINDGLNFNIDEMYLTKGNQFLSKGYAVFKYGNEYPHKFSNVRWLSSEPIDTHIMVRTRVSNNEDMSDSLWSPFILTSGGEIQIHSQVQYKYIELEVNLESSPNRNQSPQLFALYLDSTVVGENKTFEFNTQEAWETGVLNNIDTTSSPGSIKIKSISDIGNYVYSSDGKITQLNNDFSEKLSVLGNNLPKSFQQMLSDEPSGLGQVSSVDLGLRNSFFIADTDNDRVLEIDKSGNVLWGIMGAYPETPINPYVEGSTTSGNSPDESFKLIGCFYNKASNIISLIFNTYIENIYSSSTFDLKKMYLRAGARRIFLNENKNNYYLNGISREYYGKSFENNEYLTNSNVLKIQMSDIDNVTLEGSLSDYDPYLVCLYPKINQVVSENTITVSFLNHNCELGDDKFGIRVIVDNNQPIDLRIVPTIQLNDLIDGLHTIEAFLIDLNGNKLANAGVECFNKFYVSTTELIETVVSVNNLSDNIVVSNNDISINFDTYNIPINYGLRYIVNDGSYKIHDSPEDINLETLPNGENKIRMYISDADNNVLFGSMTDVTINFVVNKRNSIDFQFVANKESISSLNNVPIEDTVIDIDLNYIDIKNIYAPVDVQLITSDKTIGDINDFSVLICKMGVPSSLNYFDSVYKDGYSVVEYDSQNKLLFSENTAIINSNKDNMKKRLGGARKSSGDELIIADPYGKRAIVVNINEDTKSSEIVWEYLSDRIVSDFKKVPKKNIDIRINNSGIEIPSLHIRRDMYVSWYNNTNNTIRILSGKTNFNQFHEDPDLDLFGGEFDSGDILPGNYFTFRFINNGILDYFVYPFIHSGKLYISESSIIPDDHFIIVENDDNEGSYLNRIIKVDCWGNVVWEFGNTYVSSIKDAVPVSEEEIIITV